MTKLKRCPHCGGEVVRSWIADWDALQCDKCGIVTILPQSGVEGEKLIEVFNTRTLEIVRCGECRHWAGDVAVFSAPCNLENESESSAVIEGIVRLWDENDFCSYGKRREK